MRQVGEPSHALFVAERDGILESLKRRASIMVDALSKLEGVTCNNTEGAMYVFPRVTLPPAAIKAAEEVLAVPLSPSRPCPLCLLIMPTTGAICRNGHRHRG